MHIKKKKKASNTELLVAFLGALLGTVFFYAPQKKKYK
jgi:hypothetical protein